MFVSSTYLHKYSFTYFIFSVSILEILTCLTLVLLYRFQVASQLQLAFHLSTSGRGHCELLRIFAFLQTWPLMRNFRNSQPAITKTIWSILFCNCNNYSFFSPSDFGRPHLKLSILTFTQMQMLIAMPLHCIKILPHFKST